MIHNILIPALKPDDEAELAPKRDAWRIRIITHWMGCWFRVREE